MCKILIINGSLVLCGAGKFIYALIFLPGKTTLPQLSIRYNYNKEYYDPIFKQKKIKVVKTRLSTIKNFRAALNMLRSLYWSLKPVDLIAYCRTFDELVPLI